VKVPAVTVVFWVIKVLTTGTGESASDWLGHINLVLAGVVGLGGFVLALRLQLRATRYRPVVYWFAVAMVAVFGTMAADGVHVVLGVPYSVSTVFWAVVTATILVMWRRSEGSLSIHTITTPRREKFYWATVLSTFALGTAAGDLTAAQLDLGFLLSGVLFAAVMLVPALGWARMGMNSVLAFWFAYVVTRPLGASFADWFGKPHSFGRGLGYGDGTVTLVASILIVLLVGYLEVTHVDVLDAPEGGTRRHVAHREERDADPVS
jgi:uncharacterized membrane-anchored protein